MNSDQVGQIISIRYKGRMYDHYGILDGFNRIIHVNKRKGIITLDPLEKALHHAKQVTYIEDDFDARWANYVHAHALIGSKHTYKFMTSNCEHWVRKVCTGEAYSRQVDQMTGSLATGILALVGILSIGAIID